MNIALTGGGTAGHVMPNLALYDEFQKRFDNIIYIGNKEKIEYDLCTKNNIDFFACESIKFDRSKIFSNILIPFKMPAYIRQAQAILSNNSIDVVFSKGGYVALPVVYAAKKLKIPVICHESDFSMGIANKLTSKFAKGIITCFPQTLTKNNVKVFANPVRQAIFEGDAGKIYAKHALNASIPVLLVVGGSMGAKAINDAVYAAIETLTQRYQVIHICGKSLTPLSHKNYYQLQFADNIQDYIAASDMIISRCGAGASTELNALNKKALYIPLENKASRGDQVLNAEYQQDNGYALVLHEKDLNTQNLLKTLDKLMNFDKKPFYYDPENNAKIADYVYSLAREYSPLPLQ